VLITLDGMRPDFYVSPILQKHAPFLYEKSQAGAWAHGAIVAYPSTTYPGHANISTGVRPNRHGIVSSTQFHPPALDGRGYWYQGDLKAPSIWQRAHAAGLSVAALSWPSSATAPEIQWNFPEFWGSMRGSELRQVLRRATPEVLDLADELFKDEWPAMLGPSNKRDQFLTRMAEEIMVRHQPNLMLLHFIETDTVQHKSGPSSPQFRAALKRTDRLLKRLYTTVQKAGLGPHTVFIVTGDHGFTDVSYMFAPNVLLIKNGFIQREGSETVDWTAMVENTSGSAGVYLKDPDDKKTLRAIRKIFEDNAIDDFGRQMYRIVDRKELDQHGASPDAAFFLEGIPPYMSSGAFTGEFSRNAILRGNHGYLPTLADMHTGFVAFGPGIRPAELGIIELIDVAPTIAALMGFDMPDVQGRVLAEILE
jgi:predicted AlkP superfamily pyrophosphatase or phosphodiesterase